MILVDTSVWIDHFRTSDAVLVKLLETGQVLSHPFIIGELAMGNLGQRDAILGAMQDLPRAFVATSDEVLAFIAAGKLFGRGIGYVDAHLLAAVRLAADAALWTRDKRLHAAAEHLGLASH